MHFSKKSHVFLVVVGLAASCVFFHRPSPADEERDGTLGPKPVEEDMHEFMEYVFAPTYERLKSALAAEPRDQDGWKTIKSDGLILAEGGNLLLIRVPTDDAQRWREHSTAVRKLGGQLYAAAKKKDYSLARKQYKLMLQNCNACHDDFADGEYQLEP